MIRFHLIILSIKSFFLADGEMVRKLEVPSASDIADKWVEVTPARSTYYADNAKGSGDKMERNAIAAKGTYNTAIKAPGIADRFAGGLKGSGAKYNRKVESVGVDRFSTGIEAAKTDMEAGVGPYRDLLDGMTIADRKPRGDPANYKISQDVGDKLHKKRLAVLGATAAGGAS